MRPHSLLFSSDEEASRALSHAFKDLEFEVETCPEIFSAVEKITTRSFDVVVSDWNEGLEAVFLLKTVRELKGNHSAFTLAIANPEGASAAREAGADLVLSRPLVPDEVKYALLTSDSFLAQMKSWLTRVGPSPAEASIDNKASAMATGDSASWTLEDRDSNSANNNLEHQSLENRVFDSLPRLRPWPSPPPQCRTESVTPVVAAEPIFEDDLLYHSRVQTLFQEPQQTFSTSSSTFLKKGKSRVLPGLAIAVAFLSVGYVFSEPLRGERTTNSVARMCGRVLQKTEGWLYRPTADKTPAPVQTAEETGSPQFVRPGRAVSRITITPVRDPYQNDAAPKAAELVQPVPAETQPSRPQPVTASAVRIPESLKMQVQSASMRSVAERITPSLLAALEPVALSEDLSRRLLLQKVLPNYPERAVKARLQGAVVLQAMIGRDGTIQDLKLVRGSMLLGQAAYRAVKQWRYQPYLVNGRAVEAETFVTVDFRLP